MATVAELTAERASLERDLAFVLAELTRLERIGGRPGAIADARAAAADLRAELAANQVALAQATSAETPTDSAGSQVINNQNARADSASTQAPPLPAAVQTSDGRVTNALAQPAPTNAVQYNATARADSGTNSATRSITNTQSVPPNTAQPSVTGGGGRFGGGGASGSWADPKPTGQPGVGAGGDDKATAIRNRVTQIYSGKNAQIVPQENSLGKYSSYTYNISLYILSPEDYRKMIRNKKVSLSGSNLLIQSGGMPFTSSTPTPTSAGTPTSSGQINNQPNKQSTGAASGRNPFFPLDYYIDGLKLTGIMPGKGTNSSHNITQLSFRITEPNGISLLDNLYEACAQYVGKKENYGSQNYLLVIRFYGYDQNGNLVKAFNGKTLTDSRAVIEKYIPFQLTGIKFKVANNLTEYSCEGVAVQNNIASGQGRGTIPYNVEVQAATLTELFGGPATYSAATPPADGRESSSTTAPSTAGAVAPAKGDAAPKPTITSGLIEALNTYQRELVTAGTYEYADKYNVVFLDPVIGGASTKPPDDYNLKMTGSVAPGTANQQINPATNSVQTNTQTKPATAGTNMIQFIDQAVRNSSYIYKQQTHYPNPDPKGKPIPNGTPAQVMAWFRIGLQVEPTQYDKKRKDYAYNITYSIAPYLVNDLKSNYFPQTKYRGTHKRYAYWFTGENTEVLNFEQDFNYLYYIVINGNTPPGGFNDLDFREDAKRSFQPRSNESDQGQEGKTNEPAANAADILYSPSDLARARLSIVGDPAWISQGETWAGISGQNLTYGPFFPDGTINTEIEEPLFEIAWNKPVDYDLSTGLMNPNQRKAGANDIVTNTGPGPTQAYIYRAISVVSNFDKGRFTQDLEGVLVNFPQTSIKKNQATPDGKDVEIDVPKEQDAEKIPSAGASVNRAGGITVTNEGGAATSITRKITVAPPGAPPGSVGTGLRSRRTLLPSVAPTAQGVNNNTTGKLKTTAPTSGNQVVGPANAQTPTGQAPTATPRTNQNGSKEY